MKSLVPGCFTTAVVRTTEGELEAQLSEGGHWQVKVRSSGENEWRLLCVGHLDGRVLAPSATLAPETQEPVKIGPLSVDFVRRQVTADGTDPDLSPREFDLLALLASEPGRLFSKDEMLREVWGHPEGAITRTIEYHVSSIRRKLRSCGIEGFIVNYRGHGYKFCEGVAL
jgi:DNA-binding response OmpR family regulator